VAMLTTSIVMRQLHSQVMAFWTWISIRKTVDGEVGTYVWCHSWSDPGHAVELKPLILFVHHGVSAFLSLRSILGLSKRGTQCPRGTGMYSPAPRMGVIDAYVPRSIARSDAILAGHVTIKSDCCAYCGLVGWVGGSQTALA